VGQDVPKFVLKRLPEAADTESHPDADLLTAFAEQSLVDSERMRVVEHIARCADCREVVALALPATEDGKLTASTIRSGWSAWPVLRWSVVAAGIVALASVGILQYWQRHQRDKAFGSVLLPQNERTATAELANQPPAASSDLQEIRPQKKNGERAGTRKNAQSNRQDTLATNNSARSNQLFPAPRRGQAATGAELAPNPDVGQRTAIPASSQTVEGDSQGASVAPATEKSSDQLSQDKKEQSLKENAEAVKASARWSINSDGRLQRSLDLGHTWADINPDLAPSRSTTASMAGKVNEVARANRKVKAQRTASAGFRALAAFDTEVWAGGSAAMLYHSGDSGAHWTRVFPSSSGAALTGDITSIEFSDPQHGRIATSNGEVWITADAGQTWRRQ
jgi:photosynthesis system II assembly factor YCF48-like protein/putative zinc finger protein